MPFKRSHGAITMLPITFILKSSCLKSTPTPQCVSKEACIFHFLLRLYSNHAAGGFPFALYMDQNLLMSR